LLDDLKRNSFFTVLKSWLRGEEVGKDEYGNRYFRRARRGGRWRQEERWVLFAREAEPTEIPPGWVGWLHKRIELPPSQQPLPAPKWEKERLPAVTGTGLAYRPPGSLQRGGQRAPATGDYEAWSP
jgi:NADH:ubiquinone oxidoreductase subunit